VTAHDRGVTTLHIEHPITGYEQWRAAFDHAEHLRTEGGVIAQRVSQPIDDDRYIVVQLDFDDAEHAAAFLDILRTRIWADPARAPGLGGSPRTLVLQPAEQTTAALPASGNNAE
jgi:hypothetical protein